MFDTKRLEAFSDGVLAVAITLLSLDLRESTHSSGLSRDLLHLWPNFAAYAVSFLVIGIIWVNHHDTFSRIRSVDRRLQLLNLLLLMVVVVIPFATAVFARHLRSGHDSHAGAVFYAGVMVLVGLAFTGIWLYVAAQPELLAEGTDAAYARTRAWRTARAGPLVYFLAGVAGLASAAASLVMFAAVAVYFALSRSAPVTG